MSWGDHDTEEIRNKLGRGDRTSKKEIITQINDDDFPKERIDSYIKIYNVAKSLQLEDFINWCKGSDYYFEKPIKTPKNN